MRYYKNLTDRQAKKVLVDEHRRYCRNIDPRFPSIIGPVAQRARVLYREARKELLRRNICPDQTLRDAGCFRHLL